MFASDDAKWDDYGRFFNAWLQNPANSEKVNDMIANKQNRFTINLDTLR